MAALSGDMIDSGVPAMNLSTAMLPDGRAIHCVNAYEVEFSVHEIFNDDLAANGIDLPPDGTYFDVGANIGLFSLFLLGNCPRATIFAYEPMADAFTALQKNIAAFAPTAQAIPIALGASPGVAEFDYFPGITALSTSNSPVGSRLAGGIRKLLFSDQAGEDVSAIFDRTGATDRREDNEFVDRLFRVQKVSARVDTLSNEISIRGVTRIDLLKVDTEGAERAVLAGIAESDWPKIRQLMVEVHLGKEETDDIREQLQQRGFRTSASDHPMSKGGVPVYHVYATRGAGDGQGPL